MGVEVLPFWIGGWGMGLVWIEGEGGIEGGCVVEGGSGLEVCVWGCVYGWGVEERGLVR